MPRFVEQLTFDSKLFDLSVGRIDLSKDDCELLLKYPTIHDILGHANSAGYQLIYIFAPPLKAAEQLPTNSDGTPKYKFLGEIYDQKTTFAAPLTKFDKESVLKMAFYIPAHKNIRIRRYDDKMAKDFPDAVQEMKSLAVASGVYSRFKIDKRVPDKGFEGMFHAWLANSMNHSIADEIFVAYDAAKSNSIIGFITLKRKELNVNIGLLSVAASHRRMGIAYALLSRALLWAEEEIGWSPDATMNVVTQGSNEPACKCYERFGYELVQTQSVYHCWLPENLEQESRADMTLIPFCKQHFTGKEIDAVAQVFTKGLDSASHFTLMCSSHICDTLGDDSTRVVMVPSGTAALEMAALLCDLKPGDEVIMPSYTFSSTANAFVLRGAVPVFVDSREDNINIDETLIEAAITERTKAICCVHYGGVPCEMDTICSIAKKHKLFVVEDAAQAYLSTYKGRQLGTIGDFGCFSFHYTKNVICGEGGAVSINRSMEMARRALVLWEKGTNRYDFVMGKIDKYEWIDIGSSYVPSEVSCAILWPQLAQALTTTNKRKQHFETLRQAFSGAAKLGLVQIPKIESDCESNGHIFYLLLSDPIKRKEMEVGLKKKGVAAFMHYVPLHSAPAGKKYCRVGSDMTVTDRVAQTLVRLPVWPDLTEEEVSYIITCVSDILMRVD